MCFQPRCLLRNLNTRVTYVDITGSLASQHASSDNVGRCESLRLSASRFSSTGSSDELPFAEAEGAGVAPVVAVFVSVHFDGLRRFCLNRQFQEAVSRIRRLG